MGRSSSARQNPADLDVRGSVRRLREGTLTAAELLEAYLRRIGERNGGDPTFEGTPDSVNAWARVYGGLAAGQARAADERLKSEGDSAPLLCGIPLALKDLYSVRGLPLTGSSRMLDGEVAVEDSAVWHQLARDSAVLVGHTHTHEFAAGGTTDQVGNPWSLERSPGGSSGGSAAALAAGMIPLALGTDTAGSLRIPAALCGIAAFKPSYGRVPLEGVIPLAPTLDHGGPMGRSLADCSMLLPALTRSRGRSTPWNATPAVPIEVFEAADSDRPLAGMRIAVTNRPQLTDIEADVAEGLDIARRACEQLGATIVEILAPKDLPREDYDTILLAEARAYHAQYSGRPSRYRDSTREFLAFEAAPISAAAYLAAQGRRIGVTDAWQLWFQENGVDAILEPTTPGTAPLRGHGYDAGREIGGTDKLALFTATWNVTGFPVAAIPSHLGSRTGMPVGVSLVGAAGQDRIVLQMGLALQRRALPPLGDAPSR